MPSSGNKFESVAALISIYLFGHDAADGFVLGLGKLFLLFGLLTSS